MRHAQPPKPRAGSWPVIPSDLDAYTKTTPPHVRAARHARRWDGRIVAYTVTVNGPVPVGEERADPNPATASSTN